MNSLNENISLIELNGNIKVIKRASGFHHFCALTENGQVFTYGNNQFGQLGDGTNVTKDTPQVINFTIDNFIIDICCGCGHTLLLTQLGEVYSFGQNSSGQLGYGYDSRCESLPIKVLGLESNKIVKVSSGETHCLALSGNNKLFSWGHNNYGQLGNGCDSDSNIAKPITFFDEMRSTRIIAIACGSWHSLILTEDGEVFAFGWNRFGQCGVDLRVSIFKSPVKVNTTTKFINISSQQNKCVALSATGSCYVWGECGQQIFEAPVQTKSKTFEDIYDKFATKNEPSSLNFIENSVADQIKRTLNVEIIKCVYGKHMCTALTNTGRLFSWEFNNENIILFEQKVSTRKLENLEISTPKPIIDVACGHLHVNLITIDGELLAFGDNGFGQIGDVSETDAEYLKIAEQKGLDIIDWVYTPGKPKSLDSEEVVALACGEMHSLVLTKTGKVFASGLNVFGQIGVGKISENYFIKQFTEISGNIFVIKIACGSNHSLMLSDYGCVYGFGFNVNGQVGSGLDDVCHYKPITRDNKVEFIDIDAYKDFSIALSRNGICYVWGNCLQKSLRIPTETQFNTKEVALNFYKQLYNSNLNDKIKATAQHQWFKSGDQLGSGVYSTVVRSNYKLDKTDYAVRVRKLMYEDVPKVWNELSILRKLRSDYVTQIFDFWIDENTEYKGNRNANNSSKNLVKYVKNNTHPLLLSIQMEVCDATLKEVVNRIETEFNLQNLEILPVSAYFIASQLLLEIFECIDYLHQQTPPVIHGDIKSDNILIKYVNNNGRFVRISDFNLSTESKLNESQQRCAPEIANDWYRLGLFVIGELLHIDPRLLTDIENMESDDLITSKYKNSANLFERLMSRFMSVRPSCSQALNEKQLWCLDVHELDKNIDYSQLTINDNLLKRILVQKYCQKTY